MSSPLTRCCKSFGSDAPPRVRASGGGPTDSLGCSDHFLIQTPNAELISHSSFMRRRPAGSITPSCMLRARVAPLVTSEGEKRSGPVRSGVEDRAAFASDPWSNPARLFRLFSQFLVLLRYIAKMSLYVRICCPLSQVAALLGLFAEILGPHTHTICRSLFPIMQHNSASVLFEESAGRTAVGTNHCPASLSFHHRDSPAGLVD